MKWTPKPYMRKAMTFLLRHACAALFLDPGLGKTSICLATFKILKSQGMAHRALVIAPLRPARSVWAGERGEAKKWNEFRHLKISLLHGKDKDELLRRKDTDFDIINPEGLPWLFSAVGKQRDWPWDVLIIDESSRFKHTGTLRFKILRGHLHRFARRYILTGTPAPNGLLDLFGQIYLLDLGNALGRFITHYRYQFFIPTGYGGYTWVLKKGADKVIYRKLENLALRMDAKDYLDLPPLIINDVDVELPAAAKDVYDQMESLLLATVQNELVTAVSTASAMIKCSQIANGGIYTGKDTWKHVHEAKTEAAQEIVDELEGKPAFIAYEFKHDRERLQRAFKGAPYLGGGVTGKEQAEIEEAWNAGQLPILLAQPKSVAHGLNLQGVGAAIIWYGITWDLEEYDQFIRRIWRQGQTERIVAHRLIARGTVDEAKIIALRGKARTQGALLAALRQYALTK